MSSHHFVKEGQEPAIIVAENIPFGLAGPLLEWVPMVLVLPDALEAVVSWGIKIDVAIAEPGHAEALSTLLSPQGPVIILPQGRSGSLDAALLFLRSKGRSDVNILLAAAEPWLDQLSAHTGDMTLSLITPAGKWWHTQRYRKWLPANSVIRVLSRPGLELTTCNLSERGHSFVAIADGMVELQAIGDGNFWVCEESHDA